MKSRSEILLSKRYASSSILKCSTIKDNNKEAEPGDPHIQIKNRRDLLLESKFFQDQNGEKKKKRGSQSESALGFLEPSASFRRSLLLPRLGAGKQLSQRDVDIKLQEQLEDAPEGSLTGPNTIQLLIHGSRWKSLLDLIAKEEGQARLRENSDASNDSNRNVRDLRSSGEDTGRLNSQKRVIRERTLLHMACKAHPPLEVVKQLALASPQDLTKLDGKQRTPLHMAAMWGASPQVIRFLVELNPQQAIEPDKEGKSPLDLHFEFCSAPNTCDPGKQMLTQKSSEYEKPQDKSRCKFAERITSNAKNADNTKHCTVELISGPNSHVVAILGASKCHLEGLMQNQISPVS